MRVTGFRFILIYLLVLGAVVPAVAQDDESDVPPAPVVIDSAVVEDLTGDDPVLVVEGSLGTGCNLPVVVDQTQDGDTLTVWLYQEIDAATICPAILVPYSDTIPLEIAPAGSVTTVIVNGQQTPIGGDESSDDPGRPVVESVRFEPIPQDGSPAVTLWQLVVTCAEGELCNGSGDVNQQMRPGHIVVDFAPGTSGGGELVIPLEGPVTLNDNWADFDLFAEAVVVEVNDYAGLATAQDTVTVETGDDEEETFTAVNRFADGPDGEQIVRTGRDELAVAQVTPQIDPETPGIVALNVNGTQANGCNLPVLTRQSPVEAGDEALTVTVYTIQPPEIMCPAMLIDHELEITLEGSNEDGTFRAGTYTASINDASVTFSIFPPPGTGNVGETFDVEHVIESVTVEIAESDPPQLFLSVAGYQTDGCETEVFVDQARDGDTFTVRIYRQLLPSISCPAVVLDYEERIALGPVPPGAYTIIVNGVTSTVNIE